MKQECIPVGCVPSAAVAAGGGGVGVYPSMHWTGGCLPGGICLGAVLPGGGCGCVYPGGVAARGVCISQHALGGGVSAPVHAGILSPVDRILDTHL